MNYRHAYHAGNVADCMKHALLVWLIRAMQRKPGALFVLDTHAGAGRTDLDAEAAARTGEWRHGIGRLLSAAPPRPPAEYPEPYAEDAGPLAEDPEPLAEYLALVRGCAGNIYPGSPLLLRAMLRADDRLACCELHPEEHASLRRLFVRDRHVAVHARDGWQAIAGLLPPRVSGVPMTRGLTLIDPPFEQPGEFSRLLDAIRLARRRFAGGVVAAWYPIKHRAPVRDFHDRLRETGEPDLVCAELLLRPALDPTRLNGSGLLVAGAPWGFEAAATAIVDAIADRSGESQARGDVLRLTPERQAA